MSSGWRLLLARGALGLATLTTLAVPSMTYRYVRHLVLVGRQARPVVPAPLAPGLRQLYTGYAHTSGSSFVVIGYHDLVDGPAPATGTGGRRLSVSVSAFAAQLRMLKLAGYQSVSAGQVRDYLLRRTPLPIHAVLISFDGARVRDWTRADPVLASVGYRATIFVNPATVVNQGKGVLSWARLQAMVATGRWSLGVAPDAGATVPVDAAGTQASALLAHRWLDGAGRPEGTAEFRERIRGMLVRSRDSLSRHGLPAPTLFSYPFQPDYPLSRVWPVFVALVGVVGEVFAGSLLTDADQAVTSVQAVQRLLSRIEVYTPTTDRILFARVSEARTG